MRTAARRAVHRLARQVLPRTPPGVREVALALAARAGSGPAVLPGVPSGPVLVVAAHPDDETIGCGGALARHAAAGGRATVVVATSGEATGGGGRDVAAARERECRAACAALGLGEEPVFLHLPDGRLGTRLGEFAAALRRLGGEAALAYVPNLLDPHPDHRAANVALADAGLGAEVLGTELWSAAPVDAVVDVGGVWDRKDRALRCYQVALESVDYRAAAAGLAVHRGVMTGLGPAGRAEGFVRLPAAEHRALTARLR